MATKSKQASKSSAAVITPKGVASYAFVWKPQPSMNPGQDPKYSITLIVPKKSDLSALKRAVTVAGKKKFGDGYENMVKRNKLTLPFRDGDEEREGDELYKGKIFFSAKSSQKPGIVDEDRNPIEDEFDFYSGCKCRISVYAYGYDVNGNKGVAFALNNIQKLGDGERLSGRRAAEEEFDEDADSDDSTDSDDDDDDMLG
jgi:hypothetical protein